MLSSQSQEQEPLPDEDDIRSGSDFQILLASRALGFLEDLVAYEGTGRTVEQLLDKGEQLLREDRNIR